MKDYTVRRYTFEELEEGAKEKAVKDYCNFLNEVLDSSSISDYLMDRVEYAIGGQESEIDLAFSLSYCQGDGVALYGTMNRLNAPDLSWPEGASYVELSKNSWGHYYSHWNSFNVDIYDEEGEVIEDKRILETQLRDLCRELERDGYKFIEGCTSEEVAGEELREADAVFTLEGKWDVPAGVVEEVQL
jgi:hypothetical protein